MIDELLDGLESSEYDAEYSRRIEELKHFSGIPKIKVPEGFVGELRPYRARWSRLALFSKKL